MNYFNHFSLKKLYSFNLLFFSNNSLTFLLLVKKISNYPSLVIFPGIRKSFFI